MTDVQNTQNHPNKTIDLIVWLPEQDDARLTFVSDTLFDGLETPATLNPKSSTPGGHIYSIQRIEDLAAALDPQSGVAADRSIDTLFVDLEALQSELSSVLVGLGAICSQWQGGRLVVCVPIHKPENYLSPLCDLLRSLETRAKGVRIISCPTCARCHTDLVGLTKQLEGEIKKHGATLDVALMGCEVNGPGEAKAADVGVAFGKGIGIIFRNGEIIKRLPEAEAGQALLEEVAALAAEAAAKQ